MCGQKTSSWSTLLFDYFLWTGPLYHYYIRLYKDGSGTIDGFLWGTWQNHGLASLKNIQDLFSSWNRVGGQRRLRGLFEHHEFCNKKSQNVTPKKIRWVKQTYLYLLNFCSSIKTGEEQDLYKALKWKPLKMKALHWTIFLFWQVYLCVNNV